MICHVVMTALLHDVVDTALHPSKLGHLITIPDTYVQWLCAQHHSLKVHAPHPDLALLLAVDSRISRYARLLAAPTKHCKLAPVDTPQLAHQL